MPSLDVSDRLQRSPLIIADEQLTACNPPCMER